MICIHTILKKQLKLFTDDNNRTFKFKELILSKEHIRLFGIPITFYKSKQGNYYYYKNEFYLFFLPNIKDIFNAKENDNLYHTIVAIMLLKQNRLDKNLSKNLINTNIKKEVYLKEIWNAGK